MSRLSAEDYVGWREPFMIIAELVRTRGASEKREREWYEAVVEADRLISLSGWSTQLAPGFQEVNIGVRPVYRPHADATRIKTPPRFYERNSHDAKLGIAKLALQVAVPRKWVDLPAPIYKMLAVGAILDTLVHVGLAAGIGPPPMRAKPKKADDHAGLSDDERIRLGRWVIEQMDNTPSCGALVVARSTDNQGRRWQRQRFLNALGDAREVVGSPASDAFHTWRIRSIFRTQPAEGADREN
jgi:hypothetical protein